MSLSNSRYESTIILNVVFEILLLQLIREYDSDDEVKEIVDRYEVIYFLPVMNPDGYQFSWDSVSNLNRNKLLLPQVMLFSGWH